MCQVFSELDLGFEDLLFYPDFNYYLEIKHKTYVPQNRQIDTRRADLVLHK